MSYYNRNNYQRGNQYSSRYGRSQQPRQKPKFTQGLSEKEIAEAQNKHTEFTLKPSKRDIFQGKCTHRRNGRTTLVPLSNGMMKCTICGAEFKPIKTPEQAKAICENMEYLMQSVKMYFLDIPQDFLEKLLPMSTLINKVPALFGLALRDTNKYFGNTMQHEYGRNSAFDTYRAIETGRPMYGGNGGGYDPYADMGAPYDPRYDEPQVGPLPDDTMNVPMEQDYGYNPITEDGGTAMGYGDGHSDPRDNNKAQVTKQFEI